jgi:hypothetical protein
MISVQCELVRRPKSSGLSALRPVNDASSGSVIVDCLYTIRARSDQLAQPYTKPEVSFHSVVGREPSEAVPHAPRRGRSMSIVGVPAGGRPIIRSAEAESITAFHHTTHLLHAHLANANLIDPLVMRVALFE